MSSVQFPDPIFWTPSPSNPETILRPNPQWTLGTFRNKNSPALSPRLLRVDNIPAAYCNLRSLISWFQLFGALVYVEHAGSAGGSAILEYADLLGGWRAMTCEFPAWGHMTVSAKYESLMRVKGYGEGRKKGRTTLTGIQTGTSAGDSRNGNRGVKRRREETEVEDREVDAHFGVPVPPLEAPMAQSSRPSIMKGQWLTKIIDGQEYIIVDGDEDDPDIMVHEGPHEAPQIKVKTEFASKFKKGKRRRPRHTVSRPENNKRGTVDVDLPLPLHDVEIETSDMEVEAIVENELQDNEVEGEYEELLSSEDEDDNSGHSEASAGEIPEPEPFTMVGRM